MTGTDWIRGFEDATELALIELDLAKDKAAATERLRYILGIIKERKIGAVKRHLAVLKQTHEEGSSDGET